MEKEYQPSLKIDIIRCIEVWKKNLLLTILCSLLIFFATTILTVNATTDIYQAYSSVYTTAGGGYDIQEAFVSNAALQEYADVITSLKVLNQAADMVGDDQITGEILRKSVNVSSLDDSSVLRITVNHSEPNVAVAAANAVATSFVTEISAITGQSNIHVLDVAEDYDKIQDGTIQQWMLRILASILAFAFVSVIWVLIDVFSTKIHSVSDTSLDGELDVLGIIPEFEQSDS